jgi:hypothetical protein
MLSNKQQKENVTTRAGRERMMGGIDALYRSGDIWVSVPWSIISAIVLSWATIRDVAIALCNGKSDCAHAISPPNLFPNNNTIIAIYTSFYSSYMNPKYKTLNPELISVPQCH